jgi:uncharacterized protein (DUF983 family)
MNNKSTEEEEAVNLDDIGRLTFVRALFRGANLRCPACGRGRLFRGWFSMNNECSECQFGISRPPGYFLGSTYINYGATAFLTTATYITLHFGLQWPKEKLLPWMLVFCGIFPLVFFRFARSLWLSLDCLFDRVGASEAMSGFRRKQNDTQVENNDD